MKVIIPMAGFGDRFVKAGYTDPKPLIEVNGKKIIEHILNMFNRENDQFIFICNKKHSEENNIVSILKSMVKKSEIYVIDNHKKGPVYTVLSAGFMNDINDNEEIIISYCDNPYLWDYNDFQKWLKINKPDGCIMSHCGFHPHRLSPTFMAHIKNDENLNVIEIKEKEPYSSDFMSEHASTGTYYFRKWGDVKKYFEKQIQLNIQYNGEYYITLTYNLLIKDGLKVMLYPSEYVSVLGTPEELETFEAWQKILSSPQKIRNTEDLIKCFNYWKSYNERNA